MFLKFASRMCSTVHGIVQSVWIKDSALLPSSFPLFQRISSSSSDTCLVLFGRLPCTASQAKLFLFVLQHLFGRTKFPVTYNEQGAAFVLQVSINQCPHYCKAFWFIIFTFFIVYFGVEMLEQSVKLNRLLIFYFISNFLLYAPMPPKREPKTSAFRSVFVLEQFFSSFRVVSVAKANVLETQTIAVFARNWSRADSNFDLIGSQRVPLFITQSERHVCYFFLHRVT